MHALSTFDLPGLEQYTLCSSKGLEYRIVIAHPSAPPPAAGYPVIYVLDGNAWTSIISEVIRVNKMFPGVGHVEPAVVVGIGYPTQEAFDIPRRIYDLTTPWADSWFLRAHGFSEAKTGGADTFLDFIEHAVKPDIERQFDIDRSRQVLFGHSLGGLFTLRTLLLHSDSFQSYIAISPAIFWNNGALLKDVERFKMMHGQSAEAPKALRLFVAVGDLEQNLRPPDVDALRRQIPMWPQFEGKDIEESLEECIKAILKMRYVDNAREITTRLAKIDVETQFVNFGEEDHFSVLPAAISRSLPFSLR